MDQKGAPPINLKNNIREDVSKHFQKKKDKPPKKKKSNLFLIFFIVILALGVLFALSFFLYSFFGGSLQKTQEAEEEIADEVSENMEMTENGYLNEDEDEDGLTTGQEMELGTKVNEEDTDADGMPDGWEAENELDPLDYSDSLDDDDDDKLSNLEEYRYNVNPQNPDTDRDGYKDGEEVMRGYNPQGSGELELIDIVK